jgi:hypothetical protein
MTGCYRHCVAWAGPVDGSIGLETVVRPDGRVGPTLVHWFMSSEHDFELETCMVEAFDTLRFRSAPRGGVAFFTQTFWLRAD